MKKTSKSKRILSAIAAAVVLFVAVPILSFNAAAVPTSDRVADAYTLNSWRNVFPENSSRNAGGVWTDKSVFTDAALFQNLTDLLGKEYDVTMKDADNNFLIALSALASNKSIVGYSYLPTDTMIVLDVSNSMKSGGNDAVEELVYATNSALTKLLSISNHNRVGVVLYSGSSRIGASGSNTATLLLPLDRYKTENYTTDAENGKIYTFIETDRDEENISVANGVLNSKNNSVTASKGVTGGTYIQNGIYKAMEEMLDADTVIPDGMPQAGISRTPIMVLMSDGDPTVGTSSFNDVGTSNLGDGGKPDETLRDVLAFVTQLTAANAKNELRAHYGGEPLFYTLGVGVSGDSAAAAVLNPSAYLDRYGDVDEHWDEYIATNAGVSLVLPLSSGGKKPQTTAIKRLASITADSKNYVTKYFAANATGNSSVAQELINSFDEIVSQIVIQSLYYPTLVDPNATSNFSGYLEILDVIGHYMEIKDIKGITLGNRIYTGAALSKNFNSNNHEFGTIEAPTDLGNQMIWAIIDRLGIDKAKDENGELMWPTQEQRVEIARDIVHNAYVFGQLHYESDAVFSNYIGWYADKDGNYCGFWHEGLGDADVPDNAVFINKSYGFLGDAIDGHKATDMMYVSIQIHTEISSGMQTMLWRIPASLIPVVSYNVTLNAGSIEESTEIKMEYDPADPIRLLYEVGMSDDINAINIASKVSDKSAHIIDNNSDGIADDGKYYFYSNWFIDDQHDHLSPPHAEETFSIFRPGVQNERYYFTEATPVLVKDGNSYSKYKGAAAPDPEGEYYRVYNAFETALGSNVARIIPVYERLSKATLSELSAENDRNDDNTWDIAPGTIHRYVDDHTVSKGQGNLTDTYQYASFPGIYHDQKGVYHAYSVLGNNGRLAVTIPQGIKIEKFIDDTLDANSKYTVTITSDDPNANEEYRVADENGDIVGKGRFSGGTASVTVDANSCVYILDLPHGNTYTVTESSGNYMLKATKVNGSDVYTASVTVSRETVDTVSFYNTAFIETNTSVVTIHKTVTVDEGVVGADYAVADGIKFTFDISTQNLAAGDYQTTLAGVTATVASDGSVTFGGKKLQLENGESIGILGLPSGASFTVAETDIPDGFTVTAQSVLSGTTQLNDTLRLFAENRYEPVGTSLADSNVKIFVKKILNGREWLEDEFTFELQELVGANWQNVKSVTVNKNTTKNADGSRTLEFDVGQYDFDRIGAYDFRIVERHGNTGGVTYDVSPRYFRVNVTDDNTDGRLEIKSVVSESATDVDVTSDTANNVTSFNVVATVRNNYSANVGSTVTVIIEKEMDDRVGKGLDASGFKFGLYSEGTLIEESPETQVAPGEDKGKTSIKISIPASAVGRTYSFMLKEIIPSNDKKIKGMIYDDTEYPIDITIVDNLDGTITAQIDGGVVENGVTTVTRSFKNVYEPKAAELTVNAVKKITGRNLNDGEFSFELLKAIKNAQGYAAVSGVAPMTADNAQNGSIVFEIKNLNRIDTYYFIVREKDGNAERVTYDKTEFGIAVTVTDGNDGQLTAEITEMYDITNARAASAVEFNNVYTPKPTDITVDISIKKTVNNIGSEQIGPDGFEFVLWNDDLDAEKAKTMSDQNGEAAFTLVYCEDDIGKTFNYTVFETDSGREHVTYDGKRYDVTVSVTLGEDNKLIATVSVDGTNDDSPSLVFVNEYDYTEKEPLPPTGNGSINNIALALLLIVLSIALASIPLAKQKR